MRSILILTILTTLAQGTALAQPTTRTISREALENKIRGGWAGQMIGVAYGAPTEFRSNGAIIVGNLNNYLDWTPKRIENAIDQDDLYVEMTFAQVMDEVGLDATSEQYGEMFKDSQYQLWHANASARRLLNQGIKAPMSGHPKYNLHSDDIDFQIESDFIGLMTPGLPVEANRYADRVGRVMNWGDGLYGGMFVSGMYAAAFFEKDPLQIVKAGLKSIPAESNYAKLISDVIKWSAESPNDWTVVWQKIEDKWNKNDICIDGALQPFNIDAKLNGSYIVLGLIYGKGDFEKTLEVSTRSGQDSDCNPSSAAGILGVMLGYDGIPEKWRAGIPALADTRFKFTKYSLNEIVASTIRRTEKVVRSAGGKVSARQFEIPLQAPVAPKLEEWSIGTPTRVVAITEPQWSFQGGFVEKRRENPRSLVIYQEALGAGGIATLTFEGQGIALNGACSTDGGRADVILDGKKVGQIDAWVTVDTFDNSLWHTGGLSAGKHTLEIVTRDDANPRSSGKALRLKEAILYGPAPVMARD